MLVADLLRQREALVEAAPSVAKVTLIDGNRAGSTERRRASCGRSGCPTHEDLFEPTPTLAPVALLPPEPPQSASEPQCRLRVSWDRPGQGGAKIVVLGLQAIEPRLRHRQPGIAVLRQTETVCGVAAPSFCLLPGLHESLQRVLADGLQHAESSLSVQLFGGLQKTLVDQRGHTLENGDGSRFTPCNPLCSVEGEAAGEDRELAEQRLCGWIKQIVTPGDRLPHRLQTLWHVARTAGQKPQPARQPRQQRRR
jgi:hypothetical protein